MIKMNAWNRNWNGVLVYSQWKENDLEWTVEDLNPEDDELALNIMITKFIREATIASSCGVSDDEDSLNILKSIWSSIISSRMSLACYVHKDGKKELVGLNICFVKSEEDPPMSEDIIKGEKLKVLFGVITYFEKVIDTFKVLDVKLYLSGAGLYVLPEYRGHKLGGRILAARELMCHKHGVPATSTLFTGAASQKLATINGFYTVYENTIEDLVKLGYILSGDQTRNIKQMVKKY